MDLSDISEFKDLMTTSSYEDIPALKDSMSWKDSGLNWTFIHMLTLFIISVIISHFKSNVWDWTYMIKNIC